MANQNRYPLYVPTKSRAQYMITSKALDKMGLDHFLVIEEPQYAEYLKAVNGDKHRLVVLDNSFKEKYDLLDNLGLSKSTGPGPARNFAWEHSKANGHAWHWVMDDNIRYFARKNHGARIKCFANNFFFIMEEFVLRYMNVAMAGPNYMMFAFGAQKLPPFITNTRIYSCNFIRNDVPFRWRGRYNEDTILSLDLLKANWCTIQFNAFLQNKLRTQTVKGGNTEDFYEKEGTTAKSAMLAKVHPDCARVVWKFGRCHHSVDYRRFKKNKLKRKESVKIENKQNEFGLTLKRKING